MKKQIHGGVLSKIKFLLVEVLMVRKDLHILKSMRWIFAVCAALSHPPPVKMFMII